MMFGRRNVALLPKKLDLAEEVVFTERATLYNVLFESIRDRRPTFVLRGTLVPLCRFFGIDIVPVLTVSCSSSGLATCFGRLHGTEVVVHAAVNGGEKWVARLSEGAQMGREILGPLVPDTLDVNRVRMIAQRMPGHQSMPWKLTEHELQTAILTALEPLKQIYAAGYWTGRPDDELTDALQSYVTRSPLQPRLQPGLDLIRRWNRAHVKAVLVHGDYWVKNILFSGGRVAAIIDWDRARQSGCAGIDALHLGFMSYAMSSGVAVSELLADICTDHWHFSWLSSYCALIQEAFSLSADDIRYLAILLWLSYFPVYTELHDDIPPDHELGVDNWYNEMSTPMCEAIAHLQCQSTFCHTK